LHALFRSAKDAEWISSSTKQQRREERVGVSTQRRRFRAKERKQENTFNTNSVSNDAQFRRPFSRPQILLKMAIELQCAQALIIGLFSRPSRRGPRSDTQTSTDTARLAWCHNVSPKCGWRVWRQLHSAQRSTRWRSGIGAFSGDHLVLEEFFFLVAVHISCLSCIEMTKS
jgi:hypothetical protein